MNFVSSSTDLIIFGCGGHGRVVADSAHLAGFKQIVFVDDRPPPDVSIQGFPVFVANTVAASTWRDCPFIIAIGSNAVRARVFARIASLGARPVSVVDPSSHVSTYAMIAPGCFIGPSATVNTGAVLASNVIVNTAASVDHDCLLGAHCQVGPGCHIAGGVKLAEEVMVGIGAVIVPERSIGLRTIIGAGAVVTRDLPADVTAWGTPARIVRHQISKE